MTGSIFITLPNSFSIRNVVYTGAVTKLARSYDGQVVLLAPAGWELPVDIGLPSNVVAEPLPPLKKISVAKILQKSLANRFYRINETDSIRARRHSERIKTPIRYFFLNASLVQPLPRSRTIFRALKTVESKIFRAPGSVRQLFDRYKPTLVVATDANTMHEYAIQRHASRTGVRTAAFVRSWDVPTTKGWFPVVPDYVITWNRLVASQVREMYDLDEQQVLQVGVPQFDVYGSTPEENMRDRFLKRLGLDPELNTALFATCPPRIRDDEPLLVKRLIEHLPPATNLIIRIHPQDQRERWAGIDSERIVFQVPGQPGIFEDGGRLMDQNDLSELRDTIASSDVVICTWSTISIDTCALDIPNVIPDFDASPRPNKLSVHRYRELTHVKTISESGAVFVATSNEEFLAGILEAFEDPGKRSVQRQRLREIMCEPLDGRSAERLAEALRSLAR